MCWVVQDEGHVSTAWSDWSWLLQMSIDTDMEIRILSVRCFIVKLEFNA